MTKLAIIYQEGDGNKKMQNGKRNRTENNILYKIINTQFFF